jgi:hypothetical protein
LWGAVNSFVSIYTKESHLVFILMYSLLSFILCFWITLFFLFSFAFAKEQQTLLSLLSEWIYRKRSCNRV